VKKGLILGVALPLFGVAIWMRIRDAAPERPSAPVAAPVSRTASAPPTPPRPPVAAPPETVARRADDVRLRATLENYRGALAAGNRPLQAGLERSLRRERPEVLRLAEQAVAEARTPAERSLAQDTLDALRRMP
jgi:hypothetical protein